MDAQDCFKPSTTKVSKNNLQSNMGGATINPNHKKQTYQKKTPLVQPTTVVEENKMMEEYEQVPADTVPAAAYPEEYKH